MMRRMSPTVLPKEVNYGHTGCSPANYLECALSIFFSLVTNARQSACYGFVH